MLTESERVLLPQQLPRQSPSFSSSFVKITFCSVLHKSRYKSCRQHINRRDAVNVTPKHKLGFRDPTVSGGMKSTTSGQQGAMESWRLSVNLHSVIELISPSERPDFNDAIIMRRGATVEHVVNNQRSTHIHTLGTHTLY